MDNIRLIIAARPQAVAAIFRKYKITKKPSPGNVKIAFDKFGYPFARDLYDKLINSFSAGADGKGDDMSSDTTGFEKFMQSLGNIVVFGAKTYSDTKTILDRAKEQQNQEDTSNVVMEVPIENNSLFNAKNLYIMGGILVIVVIGIIVIRKLMK